MLTIRLTPAAALALSLVLGLATAPADAATCQNPDALGTARVLEVSAATTPQVGRKHFPTTLPLGPKELVLTFDDGPWPTTTPKVLDALAAECVRASFFMLGQHAQATPQLARRVLAAGHTVAHHTYAHPILDKMSTDAAEAEINRGFSAVDYAVFGQRRNDPATPFFRFPGFASTPALLERLQRRGIVVFGADFWASDWNTMTPERQFDLIMARTEQFGRGIVLFHDTREQTAAMLPRYLRELKKRGYKIVHIVPAGSRGSLR
ncbi:MAG: polysaccharide deacetylase family protein [Rhizobiales bacterium]|nr:polysaccharide deacetylase family protein [Hyphomicrobiales bacterium]OJY42481.1 MAG: polysaccharide deacetylase [Rhizobiales bacterium 64-17]